MVPGDPDARLLLGALEQVGETRWVWWGEKLPQPLRLLPPRH